MSIINSDLNIKYQIYFVTTPKTVVFKFTCNEILKFHFELLKILSRHKNVLKYCRSETSKYVYFLAFGQWKLKVLYKVDNTD